MYLSVALLSKPEMNVKIMSYALSPLLTNLRYLYLKHVLEIGEQIFIVLITF